MQTNVPPLICVDTQVNSADAQFYMMLIIVGSLMSTLDFFSRISVTAQTHVLTSVF